MIAIITMQGLYAYDNSIFDDLSLPEQLDKDEQINNIMIKAGELPALLPDTDVLKAYIKTWSFTRLNSWEKLCKALLANYEPTENYNMTESEEIGEEIGREEAGSNSEYIQGFETLKGMTKSGETQGQSSSASDRSEVRELKRRGNIGVTTAQKMVTEEIELRTKTDIYNIIADEFKDNFCLQIY